ncbi:MAG: DUF3822 family protein [Bacteroidales bacterium]|nr:DUF3822 family protein [Bacteroidales bacterium]
MKDISNFTSSFNINKTSTYSLSIQISQMGYTYCILDSFSKEYVAIKHVGYGTEVTDADLYDKIKDNLAADAFLSKSYKSVDMIYVTRKSIIVPNPMFDKFHTLFIIKHPLHHIALILTTFIIHL